MKFSKVSQYVLVSTLGLLAASLLSGCLIVTVDYVFVANSSSASTGTTGEIQTYAVDAESGAMRPVDTAVYSGGSSPVAMAVSGDYANLYVANQGNDTVVHFLVNADGSLTQKDSVTLTFKPAALAVNTAGANLTPTALYVVGQNVGGTPAAAELAVYSLSSGALGSLAYSSPLVVPGFTSDAMAATGVTVLANNDAVYVTAYDQSAYNPGGTVTSTANPGWLFAFTPGTTGTLAPISGSPYQAGVKPTALAADPTSRFLYATDYASNELIGYTIETGDVPEYMVAGPFKTGSEPTAVTIDPRGLYIYVADALSSNVSAYTITLSTGIPSAVVSVTGSSSTTTDTQPVSILVDPALGRYVYTANYLANDASGFRLDPNTGALSFAQSTPYPTGVNPAAIVAVPHGNHAVQSVTP
jgi:6-phosphogluconolactonase